jgi:lysine 2,3-aminomutase
MPMTEIKAAHSVSDLIDLQLIDEQMIEKINQVANKYAIGITPTMIQQINGVKDDPIARQFLPHPNELLHTKDESADPIGDFNHSVVKGLVHRYPDRVLLKLLHICPVYCRFCFRREMVGPSGDGMLTAQEINEALNYISEHKDIWEVILTGGDPLALSARRLADIINHLSTFDHVKIIRIHTRVPLVDPSRINDDLIKALTQTPKILYIAVHANHKKEFTEAGTNAIKKLHQAHISLISQTVLLRGVNDNIAALSELMRCFVEHHIKPYYIHHPDHAIGTSHFRLTLAEGMELINQLRGHLSGLCQPHYMLDIPGGYGKIALTTASITAAQQGSYLVKDFQGRQHLYVDQSDT